MASLSLPTDMAVRYIAGALFCTSFNSDVDTGTQIYKKPYPPITQGGLVDAGDNPNGLVLPTPDFKVRSSPFGRPCYWIDSKEKSAVSWQYVSATVSGLSRKYGKIAIKGIETDINWGLFLEPLFVALIPTDSANPTIQRLVVIYMDRVNLSGTGEIRYCAVYDYTLDFTGHRIVLSPVSVFNFSDEGFHGTPGINENGLYYMSRGLHGFMGDAKTFLYTETRPVTLGFPYALVEYKVFEFSGDYLSIKPESYSAIIQIKASDFTPGSRPPTTEVLPDNGGSHGAFIRGDTIRFWTIKSSAPGCYGYTWKKITGLSAEQQLFADEKYIFLLHKNDIIYIEDGSIIKSKILGNLFIGDAEDQMFLDTIAYTEHCVIASIHYNSFAANPPAINKTLIVDYRKRIVTVVDHELFNISLTGI